MIPTCCVDDAISSWHWFSFALQLSGSLNGYGYGWTSWCHCICCGGQKKEQALPA